eukprot:c25780_g1_i1.p1 GENE.c25780_g1_i1~~c25780_g1_i1.p1  ORF type:complete len:345 (+),score=29.63 c25780_g1_i1:238-1272(+)
MTDIELASPHSITLTSGTETPHEETPSVVTPRNQRNTGETPRNLNECDVCMENPRNTLLPCGHSMMCEKCASSTLQGAAVCPICRKRFTMLWVSNSFVDGKNFVQISDPQELSKQYKVLKRIGPSPSTTLTPALAILGFGDPGEADAPPQSHQLPCRQLACWYLFAFAVAIVLVFIGAITTNWECETAECSCTLPSNATFAVSLGLFDNTTTTFDNSSLAIGNETIVDLSCALMCSCMSRDRNYKSSVNVNWQQPGDHANKLIANTCSEALLPSSWEDSCSQVVSTQAYHDGSCLLPLKSEIPCGGPGASYYLFTIGWYTIILLTNLLMFLCFCYCFGFCRSSR